MHLVIINAKNRLKVDYSDLIQKVLQNDKASQYAMYKALVPKMMGVCRRYLRVREEAEDCTQEAFIKVFQNLEKYSGEGSFEGWVRRLTVNESLQFIRKNKKFSFDEDIDNHQDYIPATDSILGNIQTEELLQLLNKLPDSKKIIFNLYAIEGYSHKEIGEMLGVTEGTSKSQLFRAKAYLADLLTKIDQVS